ncbi:hypothetical protein Tco_0648925 [Tanacetum coccineum]
MVEDVVGGNKKNNVLPRPTSIIVREGGSMNVKAYVGFVNVGARSKSLLNVGDRASGVDNVGGNRVVRTRNDAIRMLELRQVIMDLQLSIHNKWEFIQEIRCGDPNHLIGECSKPPKNKRSRAFIGGHGSNNGEDEVEKTKNETCLCSSSAR